MPRRCRIECFPLGFPVAIVGGESTVVTVVFNRFGHETIAAQPSAATRGLHADDNHIEVFRPIHGAHKIL